MNYRIIIADDEPKIVQLIKLLGHWEEYGIEIIDECHDGGQALISILQNQPDFVLSDIKMPVYDGIELIQKTRVKDPDILFILLSGYRHFEYARSAIQLNVMDYLLKPIDENQLNETLEKVCRRVDQIRDQKQNHIRLSRFEEQKKENEQAQFWELLIDRDPELVKEFELMSIIACNQTYHTSFSRACYQVICIVSNLNGMLEQNDSLFSDKVKGFISNCFRELAIVYFHTTFKGHIIVLNFDENKKTEIKKAISVLYYNIRDLNEIYGNFRLNIGCSNVKYSCNEIIQAFIEANSAEWGRLIFLGNNIVEYLQIEHLPDFDMKELITEEEMLRITDSTKYLREEELSDIFSEIYKRAAKYNNSNPKCMNQIFRSLYHNLDDVIDHEDFMRFHENYYYCYLEAKNFQQLIKNIFECLERYLSEKQKKLKEKLGKPLGEAVKYIKKNYMSQISQEDAAKAGNVSSTYLSRLFKEELKIGFNEYLNQVRIEESKRLLSETIYSIKEIAVMTGYSDEKYFSKLFKKSIGIKPTEYRRLYG